MMTLDEALWNHSVRVEAGVASETERVLAEAFQQEAAARKRLERGCATCRFREDEPRTSFRGEVYKGPFCTKAGRTEQDDTPNDDDGEPIVVRCETLGNRCGGWEAAS